MVMASFKFLYVLICLFLLIDMECVTAEKEYSVCSEPVPHANITTHEAHCSKPQLPPLNKVRPASSTRKKDSTSSKSRKSHKSAKPKEPVEEEDLDALLAEMSVSEKTCAYGKCKRSPSLLGIRCSLCHNLYCVEHSIPEVHGCGDAAKERARRESKVSSGEKLI